MKRILLILFTFHFSLFISVAQDYKLVWSDEFDSNTLGINWMVENDGNPSNNELEYYTNRTTGGNVEIKDGCLVITSRRENYGSRKFTSGRINSIRKVFFTHGIIEARIKMPKTAQGLWPAFWMMGEDAIPYSWPYCGETDIVEVGSKTGFGGNEEKYISSAIHYGENWMQHAQEARGYWAPYSIEDDFHLFSCKWTEDSMAFYLDNNPKPYFRVYIGTRAKWNKYFHKPNFLLLNVAIGGNYTGILDESGITALPEAGSEEKMYVDYVRVYQKEDNVTCAENDKDKVDKIYPDPSYGVGSGILTPTSAHRSFEDWWFTLDGRRIEGIPARNGLYVHEGKKVLCDVRR